VSHKRVISWREALRRGTVSGTLASILSAVVLVAFGAAEGKAPAGPLNGPSQWLWGRHAAHRRRPSIRYSLVGYAIHHVVSIGWGTVHEKHVAHLIEHRAWAPRLAEAAATATVACFADYQIAQGRVRPGFEKQLSRKALFLVYAAFALGLALRPPTHRQGTRVTSRRSRH
jgi:hypothetical protein